MRLVFSLLTVLLLAMITVPFAVHADCANPRSVTESITCVRDNIVRPGGLVWNQTETDLLIKIINWLLSLVAILALVALIVGGIMYIVSLGSEDAAKRAKRIILYAIIGLLVVFISFAILAAVQTLFTPAPAAR